MSKGTVKEYNFDRGYGIIVDSDSNKELTVYANYLELKKGEIFTQGQAVEYEIENSRSQTCAINVRIV